MRQHVYHVQRESSLSILLVYSVRIVLLARFPLRLQHGCAPVAELALTVTTKVTPHVRRAQQELINTNLACQYVTTVSLGNILEEQEPQHVQLVRLVIIQTPLGPSIRAHVAQARIKICVEAPAV